MIINPLVFNHVTLAFDNPNYYLRIPLHTLICCNTVRHFIDVQEKLKFVVPATFMKHIMIDVSQLPQRYNAHRHMATPTAIPLETHGEETSIQDTLLA